MSTPAPDTQQTPPATPPARKKLLPDDEHLPADIDPLSRLFIVYGLRAFVVISLVAILFVFTMNVLTSFHWVDTFQFLRSLELMVTLGAAALIVALMGRSRHAAFQLFGIILIGALIVPTNDIIKFALIATGSDRNYQDFNEQRTSGADLEGRSSDVANKILTELQRLEVVGQLGAEDRKRVEAEIARQVRNERVITLLEQVKSKGALHILEAAKENIKEMVYKYGNNEKFIEDIYFLRSENLIKFPYDDMNKIQITPDGEQVLTRSIRQSGGGGDTGNRAPAATAASGPHAVEACVVDLEGFPDWYEDLSSEDGLTWPLTNAGEVMKFVLPSKGNYTITLSAARGPDGQTYGADPLLDLYQLRGDGSCPFLATDDDGGQELDSKLRIPLEAGTYFLFISSREASGDATLKIEQGDQATD